LSLVFFVSLLILAIAGFLVGRSRAAAANRTEKLHSRPPYHGAFVLLCVLIPMLLILVVGIPVAHHVVDVQALTALDPALLDDSLRRGAALREILGVVNGNFSGEVTPALRRAADTYASTRSFSDYLLLAGSIIFGLLGLGLALRQFSAALRARNLVERVVKIALLACASVAVLTTVGIVFSVLFETMHFFQ
jgi:phosphate transport system permease protein